MGRRNTEHKSLRESENRDEINRGGTGHEAAIRKVEESVRRSREKARGTRVQDQRVGQKIASLSAKAGEGIYTMGATQEAPDTLRIRRREKRLSE